MKSVLISDDVAFWSRKWIAFGQCGDPFDHAISFAYIRRQPLAT
jgi:hypothetical protein